MKIITLNTWQERGPWQERWEVILEGIERFRPDIACFQELFSDSWAQEIQKRTGFTHRLYPQEFCGLVLYTQYPVSSWEVVQLSSSPLEEYARYVLEAELRIQGKPLVILSTHLSWKLEDGATRQKQVDDLLRLIQEKTHGGELLLTGDLNAPPDSPEIRGLIRQGQFRDLFSASHPGEAGWTWDKRNPYAAGSEHVMPDRRIDYILARGAAPILEHFASCDLVYTAPNRQGIWATDHFGVIAEFQ